MPLTPTISCHSALPGSPLPSGIFAASAVFRSASKFEEMARQALGVGLADMADAERVQEAPQRNLAARVDRVEELLHRHRAEAVDVLQLGERIRLPLLQRKDIGRRADLQRRVLGVEEELDLLLAEPFYVERIAGDEMPDALDRLRRADQPAGAAPDRLALLAHRVAVADRAAIGEHVGHEVLGRFSGRISRICGMTSPARWMMTVSPTRMSCPSSRTFRRVLS